MRDALHGAADAVEGTRSAISPEVFLAFSNGLGSTADLLEKDLIPASKKAADYFEQSTVAFEKNLRQISQLLRVVPHDLKPVREISTNLGQFVEGIAALEETLEFSGLGDIRGGIQSGGNNLRTAANVADKVFATETAEDLRTKARALDAVSDQLQKFEKNLPKIRGTLTASRKTLETTRKTLEQTLKSQADVEKLLKALPDQASEIADSLVKLRAEFSVMLRAPERLKDVVIALRQGQATLNATASLWPKVQQTMSNSGIVLRAAGDRFRRY